MEIPSGGGAPGDLWSDYGPPRGFDEVVAGSGPRDAARELMVRLAALGSSGLRALNLFIDDLYHEQKVVSDGRFPAGTRRLFSRT